MNLSVVVPVYNSELSLPVLVQRLHQVLAAGEGEYELLLVNDCSNDGSWEVIREMAERNNWITGINLMHNYGQHNTLLCGIRAATYEVIVTLDDDLQHPPEEIPALLNRLAAGYDVVYGTPRKEQHGCMRNLASKITKLALQSAMGAETARSVSAFRAFRTRVRDTFSDYKGPFVSIDVLLAWGTKRFSAVSVPHEPRREGVSSYTFWKLLAHAMNMVTGFSTVPLQFSSLIGFAFTIFGVCVLGFVLGCYLIQGGSVPGFSFLASIIVIFSGVQIFTLGIIGEYLARMHFRMMQKPTYIVDEIVGKTAHR